MASKASISLCVRGYIPKFFYNAMLGSRHYLHLFSEPFLVWNIAEHVDTLARKLETRLSSQSVAMTVAHEMKNSDRYLLSFDSIRMLTSTRCPC